jgi:hypothetical protein
MYQESSGKLFGATFLADLNKVTYDASGGGKIVCDPEEAIILLFEMVPHLGLFGEK